MKNGEIKITFEDGRISVDAGQLSLKQVYVMALEAAAGCASDMHVSKKKFVETCSYAFDHDAKSVNHED